jgi:hypothetical protein
MSEVRSTETVEAFEAPPSQSLISLSDVLAGVAWVGFHAARLTLKGTVAGARLACQGGQAIARELRESHQRSLSLPEIDRLIDSSGDNGEALRQLAATPAMDLPMSEATRWQADFAALAPTDRAGLKSTMHRLVRNRQSRLQADLTSLASEVCGELGFVPTTFRPEQGILVAKKGRETLSYTFDCRKDGGISQHSDAEGFHGGACIRTLDAVQRGMEKRGVRFGGSSRFRKDEHRAIDGARVGSVRRIRIRE